MLSMQTGTSSSSIKRDKDGYRWTDGWDGWMAHHQLLVFSSSLSSNKEQGLLSRIGWFDVFTEMCISRRKGPMNTKIKNQEIITTTHSVPYAISNCHAVSCHNTIMSNKWKECRIKYSDVSNHDQGKKTRINDFATCK